MPKRLLATMIAGILWLTGCELLPANLSLPHDSAPPADATQSPSEGNDPSETADPDPTEPSHPELGIEVSPESPFWTEYAPEPTPGMIWVFEGWGTSQGVTSTATLTMEVLSVNEGTVTYRFETVPESGEVLHGEVPGDLARYHGYPEPMSYTFVHQGTESINVPAGTYEAIKLVGRTDLDDVTLWVVKGIGRVKVEVKPVTASSPTNPWGMHLKQFIRP